MRRKSLWVVVLALVFLLVQVSAWAVETKDNWTFGGKVTRKLTPGAGVIGDVPTVILQSATQSSQAGVGTLDVTGSSLSMPANWFSPGRTLKYTITGTKTGANAAMIVHLYLLDAQVMSLTASDAAAGDWTATFIIHGYTDYAKQKITGTLAVNGKVTVVDYAAATKSTASAATIKAQIQSQNAGDTVTAEYVTAETWLK